MLLLTSLVVLRWVPCSACADDDGICAEPGDADEVPVDVADDDDAVDDDDDEAAGVDADADMGEGEADAPPPRVGDPAGRGRSRSLSTRNLRKDGGVPGGLRESSFAACTDGDCASLSHFRGLELLLLLESWRA
jgi:hypothetical protein